MDEEPAVVSAKCIHGVIVDVVRERGQYHFADSRRQCPECIVQAVLDALENQTRPLRDQV